MSMLWADGYDHYGTGANGRLEMLKGVYSEVGASGWLPTATKPRNGAYSLENTNCSNGAYVRRPFGAALTEVGIVKAFWFTQLPATATGTVLFVFSDANNGAQISIVVTPSGALSAYRGAAASGTLLDTSATQPFKAGKWNVVGAKVTAGSTISATDGSVVIYYGSAAVLTLSGTVDTINTSLREYSQVSIGAFSNNAIAPAFMDDVIAYSTTGSNVLVAHPGDNFVEVVPVNGDGAANDWVRSTSGNTTGDGFAEVDDAVADDDTTYLEAQAAADEQELEIGTVDSTADDILGVIVVNKMRKTTTGACGVTVGVKETGGASASGSEHADIGQTYAYEHDVFERNPVDGTSKFTPTTLSASKVVLTRST
jgi:hypothetical protein